MLKTSGHWSALPNANAQLMALRAGPLVLGIVAALLSRERFLKLTNGVLTDSDPDNKRTGDKLISR